MTSPAASAAATSLSIDRSRSMKKPTLATQAMRTCAALATLMLASAAARADADRFTGDVGLGATRTQPHLRGARSGTDPIPFINGEDGRVFARIDTFGVKTLPLGYGALEVVGQFRGDGYAPPGEARRKNPVPLGLGTLQVTPVGAFELRALHDLGASDGNLMLARYLAEVPLGRLNLYPEAGVEYQDAAYTRYYFGSDGTRAPAFRPGSALDPYFGVFAELHVTGNWYVDAYWRRSFLDDGLAASPLVTRKAWNATLLAVAYRF